LSGYSVLHFLINFCHFCPTSQLSLPDVTTSSHSATAAVRLIVGVATRPAVDLDSAAAVVCSIDLDSATAVVRLIVGVAPHPAVTMILAAAAVRSIDLDFTTFPS
jgi:predicted amino acid dehydrogenase